MEQVLRVTPVVGLPQFNGWSHVWELSLDPQTKCVICIGIAGDNAGNIGRDITENIAQLPPRSAQGLYQTIEDCIQLASDQRGILSIAGGIFKNKRSIFATYSSTILLKRGAKVGRIIQSESEPQIIEGKFEADDVFVFSTEAARQFLSQVELSFQRGYDSDGVITGVVPALHSIEDSSTCALAFVVVTEEDESEPVYVPPAMEIDIQTTSDTESPLVSVEQESEPELIRDIEQETVSSGSQAADLPKKNSSGIPVSLILARTLSMASKIGSLSKKAVQSIMQLKQVFSSKTYVGGPSRKKIGKWLLIGTIVLAVIISIIVFFRNRMAQAEAEALAVAAPYRSQLSQIVVAASADPIPARDTASALIESIKNAQSEAEASGEDRTAEELSEVLSEAQSAYQEISGRDEVNELALFYDLRLVISDFISSMATNMGDIAAFVDTEKKEVIVLNLQTKQVFKLDVSSLETIKSIGFFGEDQFVMLADGVYSIAATENATAATIKEAGDSNRDGTLVSSFGTYVYVFNPEKRNIYRYVKEGDSYSDPVGWLLDPLGVPFDSVVSWAIDGDIWIGTEGGQLLRFASGRVEDFTITGLPDAFSSTLLVVTRDGLDNVYVLEPAQNRVVVLTKEGEFLREIKSSSLGAATSLLIDNSGDTAYVVSGSTVFELDVS